MGVTINRLFKQAKKKRCLSRKPYNERTTATRDVRDEWLRRIREEWGPRWHEAVVKDRFNGAFNKDPRDWDSEILIAFESLSKVTTSTVLARDKLLDACEKYSGGNNFREKVRENSLPILAETERAVVEGIKAMRASKAHEDAQRREVTSGSTSQDAGHASVSA